MPPAGSRRFRAYGLGFRAAAANQVHSEKKQAAEHGQHRKSSWWQGILLCDRKIQQNETAQKEGGLRHGQLQPRESKITIAQAGWGSGGLKSVHL